MKSEEEIRKMLDIVNENNCVHPVVASVLEWILEIGSHKDSDFVFHVLQLIRAEAKNSQKVN